MQRCLAAVVILLGTSAAWSAPPRIGGFDPPAVQRGVENSVQFLGKELDGANELLLPFAADVRFTGGGKEAFRVTIRPLADVTPGVYPVRVRTPQGISNLRLMVVADMPVVRVRDPNGGYKNGTLDLASAQAIQPPCFVSGQRLERDIDAFRLMIAAGQRLTLVSTTWRVGLTPDPLLRLRDGRGQIVAYAHDTPTLQRDERLDFTPRQGGEHFLELQSTGGGGWNNYYLVQIGELNYARSVFPLGGRRGERVRFEITDRDGNQSTREATIPDDPYCDHWRLPLPEHPGSLPWPMSCGDYPELFEQADSSSPQAIEWPATVNGRIARPGEADRFQIRVQPGQKLRVRAEAYHLGSSLDGFLLVYDPAAQKLLARHDDEMYRGQPDPAVDFEVPAGVESVEIMLRDTLNEGSPAHAYRLTIEQGGPDFFLFLGNQQNPTNEEDLGWHRMDVSDTLNLPRGEPAKLKLSVRRTRQNQPHYNGPLLGYDGPITIEAINLPTGVTAQPLVIPAGVTEAELLVTADAAAPTTPFEIVVIGHAMRDDGVKLRRIAERRLYLSDPQMPNLPWNWRTQKVTCVAL